MKTLRLLLVFLTGLLGLMSCQHDTEPAVPVTQLEKHLADDAQYSTFYAGLRKTGLLPELKPAALFTVLAPTNDAFTRLSGPYADFSTADRINALTDANKLQQLREILQYHLLPNQQLSSLSTFGYAQFTTLLAAPSAARRELQVARHNEFVSINGITGAVTPVKGTALTEGTVHALQQVILPGTKSLTELIQAQAQQTGSQHTLFWQALQRPAAAALLAELTAPQTDYTVLLPSDAGLRARWQRQNSAWASLSDVPDAALLTTLRLHIITQHLTSSTIMGEKRPTLAGATQWDSTLRLTGSYTFPAINTPAHYGFEVSTTTYAGVEAQQTSFSLIDQQAYNGIMHLLNGAIKP
ncbi:fasciclin domain-containing protein [Hymenobacter rigui]|nr:fasciclin domain-containing protein [Hymenobacter rigui]